MFQVKSSGGLVVCKRNYEAICNYYGEDNVIKYPIHRDRRNPFIMYVNDIISLGFGGLSNRDKGRIISIIQNQKVSLVFIDSSLFGVLSRYISKRTNAKIIVFFHNVEFDFVKDIVKIERKFIFYYRILLAFINEALAAKYSDCIIALTNKDSRRLYDLYKRKADYLIPVSIKEDHIQIQEGSNYSSPLKLLFMGSNFPPNIEAAEIIINKLCPQINAQVIIAGSGMDALQKKYNNSERLIIEGYVEDLSQIYSDADVLVMPIMSGAGMKVKTAEALGYGKNIIATTNALEGYDVEGIKGIIRCDSVECFIDAINNFDTNIPKYNVESRNLYVSKYSYAASFEMYSHLFNECLPNR